MPPRRSLIVLSAFVAGIYAVWTVRSGIRLGVDTTTYSRWADLLISLGFDLPAYLDAQRFVAPPLLYLLWIVVLAAIKVALGSSWMAGVVALNWVSFSTGAALTLAAVRRLTRSTAGLLLAALLFLVAGDLLLFVPYVLSDLMFWGLSTAVLALGVVLAAAEPGDRDRLGRTALAGSLLLAVAFLFRPVALPLAGFWVMALLAWLARPLVDRFTTALLVLAVAAAAVVIGAHAYVLMHPGAWPFGPVPGMLTMVAEEYRAGVFVHNASPPMLVDPAVTLGGFIRITLQKVLFLITPWLPHYSTAHTLINIAFFVPAYGLSAAAVANLGRLSPGQRRAAWALSLYVLFALVFHAMLLVDSDHRYRLPVLPALIILAALGLEAVRRPRTPAATARTK